ncbi:glycosyltransferase family 2 protein [Mucilaginibacter jinjuensis]|uniref:Glycosyltransferase family A protein n=1 Tax=Mucilaginibacter jinjuensis TaxID=1176721 RepID=A0ABY7T808_9SPHI|nr:glycosyltransferase family A protein [Mucilaginibacter jinjuensis]WCT11873.1 glycosyltransferase family A protein [Mucilaginibacter jinjuensis]
MPIKFSIIIPTYNRAALLKVTLQSLLAQRYPHFEILVIDDGGNDNTKATVEAFADERLSYHWKTNAERGAARNYGAALAKGSYLNFFDSDDLAYDNHLETAADYITANPQVIAFHSSYDWKSPEQEVIRPSGIYEGELNNRVFKNNILSCNNVFVRKAEFDALKFSEDRALSGTEDWMLWLSICCRYPLMGVKTITSAIIQHDTRSMTTATGDSTLKRTQAFQTNLNKDACIVNKPAVYHSAMAEMYYLSALYYAIEGKKRKCMEFAFKALKIKPGVIYTKRTLGIIKHLLIK